MLTHGRRRAEDTQAASWGFRGGCRPRMLLRSSCACWGVPSAAALDSEVLVGGEHKLLERHALVAAIGHDASLLVLPHAALKEVRLALQATHITARHAAALSPHARTCFTAHGLHCKVSTLMRQALVRSVSHQAPGGAQALRVLPRQAALRNTAQEGFPDCAASLWRALPQPRRDGSAAAGCAHSHANPPPQ